MRSTMVIKATLSRRRLSLVDVAVIASLIGIIASFSVPRFTRLANHARAAQLIALRDNLRDAAKLAHAQYVASGATLASATIGGNPIELKNGYPDASVNGIGMVVLDQGGFTSRAGAGSIIFFKTGAPSSEQCSVTYSAVTLPNSVPIIANVETSGC
jgi:type II secretory pathway pseudopilin PulG